MILVESILGNASEPEWAARLAAAACEPVADQRGPIDYKRHLADELTRRVLRQACARAAQTQEG